MIEIGRVRGTVLRLDRAVLTMPIEAASQFLTQRRVIDFKRHAAARCRCC